MSNPVQTQVNDALEPAAESPPKANWKVLSGDEGGSVVESRIPDHELLRIIGQGAYGEVWLARNVMGTYRAVKIVYRRQFEDDRPYEREFKGIQKFEPVSRSHDALVDILQIGRNDQRGFFYYVMELADDLNAECGVQSAESSPSQPLTLDLQPSAATYTPKTLRQELRRRVRLPMDECVALSLKLTSALEHLHQSGLVHRDIKPSNIIFVKGVPKIADIGLVADQDEAKSFVGTLGYIPPEGPGTPQADLYSLGKVLYEMSTGRDRQDFPQLPGDLREDSSAASLVEFNEILLKACEPEIRKRYGSAAQLVAELRLMQRGRSIKRERALQRGLAVCKKAGFAAGLVGAITTVAFLCWRARGDGQFHSVKPEVDKLVDQGNAVLLSETPKRVHQAWEFFSKAAELDPNFAPARIGLFMVRMEEATWSPYTDSTAAVNLRSATTNLLEVAPKLGEARIASSFVKFLNGQWAAAREEALLATQMRVASNAGAGLVHNLYGWYLMNAGLTEEALQQHLLAEEAFPQSPVIQAHLGHPYFVKRDFKEALAHFQKSIELEPRQYWAYFNKGSVYEETGEFVKAIREFEQGDLEAGRDASTTRRLYADLLNAFERGGANGYWNSRLEHALTNSPQGAHDVACAMAHLGGRTDEAYSWLSKACEEGRLDGLWYDLCWDHKDERFKKIAQKVGLKP